MNTVMSAGRHHAWRRMSVDVAFGEQSSPNTKTRMMKNTGSVGPALDIATGTGDLALTLARETKVTGVVGIDPVPEMLTLALNKTKKHRLAHRVDYIIGDAHDLPFPDGKFACATTGFGVRNFVNVPRALSEMVRVVRPGGNVVVLEIVRTESRGLLKHILPFYFRQIMPWFGAMLAGDREAYTYLPESVQGFLSASELACSMHVVGLRNISIRKLALGTVAIINGEKTK